MRRRSESGTGERRLRLPALLAAASAIAIALLIPAAADAAPPYPKAVVLVSGFETETPFSTPAPECLGKEGSEWNPPGGIARTLKAAGYEVFTAPVTKTDDPVPTPCSGAGEPLPDTSMVIDSNGETDANGAALAQLIGFLRDSYGVERLHVVGHSDGGLWSRSGITQDSAYEGVTIESLTTLGTPHTGSYLADLAVDLSESKCDFSNKTERDVCEALEVVADVVLVALGPTATKELTNDFLATWNPKQELGACPVSVIAGDHVDFHIPFLEYYTPSDGLVGLASAQAQEALDIDGHLIPAPAIRDLREAGVYDVVHGDSLKFLDKNNLLNQPAISDTVADQTLISGAEPCNVSGTGAGAASAGDAADASGLASDGAVQRLRAPLYRIVPMTRKGRLPKPGPEDFALSERRVHVRCGFDKLRPIPVLGDRRLRLHEARGCERRLRVRKGPRGEGRPAAVLLRAHRRRDALVRVEGDRARIRIRGRAPKRLEAVALTGDDRRVLELDDQGWTTLPEVNEGSLRIRLRARGRAKGAPADTAHLTIAR